MWSTNPLLRAPNRNFWTSPRWISRWSTAEYPRMRSTLLRYLIRTARRCTRYPGCEYHRPYGTACEQAMDITVGPGRPPDSAGGRGSPECSRPGRTARFVHRGSFDCLDQSWDRLHSWITARDLPLGSTRWEIYITEPPPMNRADLRTELNWSITRARSRARRGGTLNGRRPVDRPSPCRKVERHCTPSCSIRPFVRQAPACGNPNGRALRCAHTVVRDPRSTPLHALRHRFHHRDQPPRH